MKQRISRGMSTLLLIGSLPIDSSTISDNITTLNLQTHLVVTGGGKIYKIHVSERMNTCNTFHDIRVQILYLVKTAPNIDFVFIKFNKYGFYEGLCC